MIVWHAGEAMEIGVERSARAKRVRLKIDRMNRRAVLVLPARTAEKTGLGFAQSKAEWIAAQLASLPAPKVFCDGMFFSFLGEDVVLHHSPNAKRGVWQSGGVIWVSGQSEYLPRRVADFLKRKFRSYAQAKVLEIAAALQVKPTKVAVRDTVSRWGSCSRAGHISLSWRLGFAPLYVADYVITHEVSHLKQMNHSPAFWKTVADVYPEFAAAERWLKKNAAYLYSFTTAL